MTSYGLDILGRVVAEKAGAATLRTHVYDTAGRKQSANVTLPRPPTGVTGSTRTVSMDFTYDADGNRIKASWDGASIGWAYDGLNRVTGVDLGAEAVTRHAYDLLGRRTDTTRGAATSQYTYDIAGQLKGLKHVWSGGSLTAGYLYDDAGALVSEGLDNAAFLWQPAATLAKTTRYDDASPINALTKVDGVAQVHDGRGNRTGAAGRTWRYDSRNMLTGANAPGMAASYGYYPEGGRAWKQVNGVTTLYLELDGVEWGSYDAVGTLKERTIRASGAGGAVVAVHSPAGGLIRLLPNRQGSVIDWLRPDGTLGGAYTYDAYGNSAQAGAAGPSFRYAGMRFDAETGLYHTPNRAYDPGDGRWMQLDPIGIKDGLNRYAYVKNSPLMGVDPTGLCDGEYCSFNPFHPELQSNPGIVAAREEIGNNVAKGAATGAVIVAARYVPPLVVSVYRTLRFERRLEQVRRILKDWEEAPNKKGEGSRFQDPGDKGNRVRVDKGNPDHNLPSQQTDHVVEQKGGNIVDAEGKPIDAPKPSKTPEAHIPLDEWLKNKQK